MRFGHLLNEEIHPKCDTARGNLYGAVYSKGERPARAQIMDISAKHNCDSVAPVPTYLIAPIRVGFNSTSSQLLIQPAAHIRIG